MKYYITNIEGKIVAQFEGIDVELKDGHERHDVGEGELPGVDEWDADYE